jgi:tetratricopeptide (TPR) repeat protein
MSARVVLLSALLSLGAHADEDAKAVFNRGTALFALHHFSEAAAAYEKAFELRPDPAILYNAAQAHRLAGEKERALKLYQSLLKLYGTRVAKRAEIVEHIHKLQIAIEAEERATSAPPVDAHVEPPPSIATAPASAVVAPAEPTPSTVEKTPVTKRKWFWPVIGSAIVVVVAGATIGIVLGTSKTVDPSASFGTVQGN